MRPIVVSGSSYHYDASQFRHTHTYIYIYSQIYIYIYRYIHRYIDIYIYIQIYIYIYIYIYVSLKLLSPELAQVKRTLEESIWDNGQAQEKLSS